MARLPIRAPTRAPPPRTPDGQASRRAPPGRHGVAPLQVGS
jgi:hypothetical protein